ncbi:hypothetical protein Tco_0737153 [Tanacetum coccineum]
MLTHLSTISTPSSKTTTPSTTTLHSRTTIYTIIVAPLPPSYQHLTDATSTSIPTTTDPPDLLPHPNQHPRCHHSAIVTATLTPPSPPR